jgi:hypothetical protein
MTTEAPPTPPPPTPPPPTPPPPVVFVVIGGEAPPTPTPTPPPPPANRLLRPRIAIGVGILVVIVTTYVLSLFGVHYLQRSAGPLPPLDLSQGGGDVTIVQLRPEELKPVANRLSVNVLVYPPESLYDRRFNVLATDVAVRLYPTSDLGDLQFPKGKAPAQLSTNIEARGDPGNWPFDSYSTEPISADAFVGSGDNRKKVPARVEVTGSLDGWDITANRFRDPNAPYTSHAADNGNMIITLHRAKGPLVFDLGICLVLVSLPTLALLVAVLMLTGKRKFVPPFGTWFAAMLFAVVPIRLFLPGSPPVGAWIDQAIVQWVLIALVTAMSLYIVAWIRQGD